MYPGLKTTRTLGDFVSHQIGVISEPQITKTEISLHDKYIVVATNGLWDLIGPDELFDLINEMNVGQREMPGQIPLVIWQKIKDLRHQAEGMPINDITFVLSNLN
uniref:PPM-type phosphatase domain-containing protein n=1 Tax=Strombidium rassoulzadegani TaxID=1082188 RepID=A0A7S3FUN5_9SPIT|mmetsp:Transcript_2462/g.4162  ORF Transcript_2462/g.4162 Transcript_2462/m.4162 type:complete len:105 (+) Transcript_2462:344-658(+)